MSWSGTVTCSWCYEKGHNKRGCPERQGHIAARPDSYEARQEADRSPRRCSYCSVASGHTRRTCQVLKDDRVKVAALLREKRSEISGRLFTQGLGIGSLVKVPTGWYDDSEVGIVREIRWLTANSLDRVDLLVMYTKVAGKEGWHGVSLSESEKRRVEVLAPVSHELVAQAVPPSWENGTMYSEDEFFEKGERRKHYLFGEQW